MAQRSAIAAIVSLCVLLAAATAARGQGGSAPAATPAPPEPKVIRVVGTIGANELIKVYVDHLSEWVSSSNDPAKLIVYINGLGIRGDYPEEIHLDHNEEHLHFHLHITPENKEAWINLLGAPKHLRRPVTFRVGLEKQAPFDSVFDDAHPLMLVVIDPVYGVIALVVVLCVLFAFARLARTTNLIREASPETDDGVLRPYNLGRTQMAFWFLLICTSYLAIWLITGALDTITASLLGLMGISAGTALGEAMIDADKVESKADQMVTLTARREAIDQSLAELRSEPAASDPSRLEETRTRQYQTGQQLAKLKASGRAPRSRGLIRDILSGGADYSIHRFQMAVWTIVLGIIFLSSVYDGLTMPEFSTTLLGLMGVSSGAYIGLKFPEKH